AALFPVLSLPRLLLSAVFLFSTLFRSDRRSAGRLGCHGRGRFWSGGFPSGGGAGNRAAHRRAGDSRCQRLLAIRVGHPDGGADRSEEHTSELQSRENLVCRLLLEKKNI